MASKPVSSLVGTWILEKSENFDDFMKEIGKISYKLLIKVNLFFF